MKSKAITLTLVSAALLLAFWAWQRAGHVRENPRTTQSSAKANAGPSASRSATASVLTSPSPAAQPPVAGAEPAREPIQVLLDESAAYQQRVGAVRSLPENLPAATEESLRTFLLQRSAADQDQYGQAVKNKLMDWLCALNPPPAWLNETLQQIYHDRAQHVVLRDYAVQHLVALYEQIEALGIDDPHGTRAIRDVLWEALRETDNSIAGTTLLGLTRLSEMRPRDFDSERLTREALKLCTEPGAGELSRITAFQVCVRLGLTDALPAALEAANNGQTLAVRISAINALGALGGAEQKPLLNGFAQGNEARLKPVAQAALRTIQQKEETASRINRKG